MSKDLLLEIGGEEIPARFLGPGLEQLKAKTLTMLERARIGHGAAQVFGTPRRLAVAVSGLAEVQEGGEEKRVGPLVTQAFDASGAATKAAEGFARSCGVTLAELGREPSKKGDKLLYVKKIEGRPTDLVLAELLPGLIRSLEFPKSMRWGAGSMAFVRPIHWILALFGGEPIGFNLDGVRSGNQTRGHRFTHPQAFAVADVADYQAKLRAADVIVDVEQRREMIRAEVSRLGSESGGEVIPDEGLLREVANLVELPVVIAGKFDRRYLPLPPEVPIQVMRAHQRYFALRRAGTDKQLLPAFIAVANTPAKDLDRIARGNERVLAARLADAEFYWEDDKRTGLEAMRGKTAGMVFYKTLGTYLDKTGRVEKLAGFLADALFAGDAAIKADAIQAARYCKADLTSMMVGEFAELQGRMGAEYAKMAGFSEGAAAAIRDHYLPRSAEDIAEKVYPAGPAGQAVSLADKLDSVVACWAAGLIPTGAGDPFALRRQSQGAINIILAGGLRLDLKELVAKAATLACPLVKADETKVTAEVLEFIEARLRGQLIESGLAYDVVDAGLAVWDGDLVETGKKLEAVARMKARPDFDDLMVAFRRVMNIVEGKPGRPDTALFKDQHEAVLYSEYTRVERFIGPMIREGKYDEALNLMAGLKPSIDKFFDHVLVNVEDRELRRNRHALCDLVAEAFKKIADFSKIVVAGEKK